MKINFKLRLKNKTTLVTLLVTVVAFIYQILTILGITPKIDEKTVDTLITLAVGILASAGILIDPTTKGASDSDRAMSYAAPSDSNLDLSVVDNPISDDNETVKFKAVEDTDEPEGNYTPSDSDADITKGK